MTKIYYIGFASCTRTMGLKKHEKPTFEEPIKVLTRAGDTFVCSLVVRGKERKAEAVREWAALAPTGAVLRFIGSFSEENFDEDVCEKRWLAEWKSRKVYKA